MLTTTRQIHKFIGETRDHLKDIQRSFRPQRISKRQFKLRKKIQALMEEAEGAMLSQTQKDIDVIVLEDGSELLADKFISYANRPNTFALVDGDLYIQRYDHYTLLKEDFLL